MLEKEWITNAGLPAAIVINKDLLSSWRCGYVQIPGDHPLHGKRYRDKIDIGVDAKKRILDAPIGKRGLISFLCCTRDSDREMQPDMIFDVHGSITFSDNRCPCKVKADDGEWWFGFDTNHYGDHNVSAEYCENECESLAMQLVEFAQAVSPAPRKNERMKP